MFYFGEWTGASFNKLRLTSSGSVESIEQISPIGAMNNGVLDMVLGSDQRVYFSTATGIYAYDTSSPGTPSSPGGGSLPFPLDVLANALVVALVAIGIAVIVLASFFFLRKQKRALNQEAQTLTGLLLRLGCPSLGKHFF